MSNSRQIVSDAWQLAPDLVPLASAHGQQLLAEAECRAAFDRLEDLHCWTPDQIDMRFSYKPQRPLYLLAVRAYRLAEPKTVQNDPNYAGCKSWVPLRSGHEVDDRGAVPVLADSAFNAILKRIKDAIA